MDTNWRHARDRASKKQNTYSYTYHLERHLEASDSPGLSSHIGRFLAYPQNFSYTFCFLKEEKSCVPFRWSSGQVSLKRIKGRFPPRKRTLRKYRFSVNNLNGRRFDPLCYNRISEIIFSILPRCIVGVIS